MTIRQVIHFHLRQLEVIAFVACNRTLLKGFVWKSTWRPLQKHKITDIHNINSDLVTRERITENLTFWRTLLWNDYRLSRLSARDLCCSQGQPSCLHPFSCNVVVLILHSFIYAVCLFGTLFLRYCAIKGTVFSGVFVLSPRSVRCARVFVRPGTPGPLLGYFSSRPGYFIRRCFEIFIILFPVVKTETE